VKRPKRSLQAEATDLVIPMQADFEFDLAARCRDAVRATIQIVLDEELERLVGAGPYERSDQRVDVRNGRYPRRVVTTAGEVDVRVGRTRGGGSATAPLGAARDGGRRLMPPSRSRTSRACRRATWPRSPRRCSTSASAAQP
jgi:hypothetical protein